MPNAVFLDEAVPAVDGHTFLKELRRMPGGADPKVVFCTVENEIAALARARHAGADDVILKPFDRESVMTTFQAVGLL
jgi:two-component system chemotaxis response regulator CheY